MRAHVVIRRIAVVAAATVLMCCFAQARTVDFRCSDRANPTACDLALASGADDNMVGIQRQNDDGFLSVGRSETIPWSKAWVQIGGRVALRSGENGSSAALWFRFSDASGKFIRNQIGTRVSAAALSTPQAIAIFSRVPPNATTIAYGYAVYGAGLVSVSEVMPITWSATVPAVDPALDDILLRAQKIIAENGYYERAIDWNAEIEIARSKIVDHAGVASVYPAIRSLLVALKDNGHSRLVLAKDSLEVQYRTPPTSDADRVNRNGKIGYLAVPTHLSGVGDSEYAAALATALLKANSEEPFCGFILDLTANEGGNMWAMLGGLSPLLERGEFGSVRRAGNASKSWKHDEHGLWFGDELTLKFASGMPVKQILPLPLAVIVGKTTGSSGEAVAIAFRGQSKTKLFGVNTRGFGTATRPFKLGDGMTLLLATGKFADRAGRPVNDRYEVEPDDLAQLAPSSKSGAIPGGILNWMKQSYSCEP